MAVQDQDVQQRAPESPVEHLAAPLVVATWTVPGRAVTSGEGDGPLPLAAARSELPHRRRVA